MHKYSLMHKKGWRSTIKRAVRSNKKAGALHAGRGVDAVQNECRTNGYLPMDAHASWQCASVLPWSMHCTTQPERCGPLLESSEQLVIRQKVNIAASIVRVFFIISPSKKKLTESLHNIC